VAKRALKRSLDQQTDQTSLAAANDMMDRERFLNVRLEHQGLSSGVLAGSAADTQEEKHLG